MVDQLPLSRKLLRVYIWGWVALTPLVLLSGLIVYVSYDSVFEYFLDGLWLGILNLGILWTAVFLLIAAICFIAQLQKPRDQ